MTISRSRGSGGPESTTTPVAYPPSWIDRIIDYVGDRRGVSWIFFIGFGLFLLSLQMATYWIEAPAGEAKFLPSQAYLAAVIVFILALIRYLDERAAAALETIRAALRTNEDEYEDLRYRITTLPRLNTLMAGVFTLAVVALSEAMFGAYEIGGVDRFGASYVISRGLYFATWCLFGTFAYHTIHQLRLINRIYTRLTVINLFRMKPLHAFSNLTALTAGSLTLIPYGWIFLVNPDLTIGDPVVLSFFLAIVALAIVTFVSPQLGIHRLQVAEKEHLLDEAGQRLEAAINALHRGVDEMQLEGATELSSIISSLKEELELLEAIPTWPWNPATVRWLATALVLPLGLWFVQLLLGRVLGS